MKPHALSALTGLVALALFSTVALADPAPVTPKQAGNIEFITGGIGDEERTSMEAVKNDYNLHVMSAGRDGAFTGSMTLTILDKENQQILQTDIGPLFYAKLPDGTYTVEGTHNNQTKSEKISLAKGKPAHIHFGWK